MQQTSFTYQLFYGLVRVKYTHIDQLYYYGIMKRIFIYLFTLFIAS